MHDIITGRHVSGILNFFESASDEADEAIDMLSSPDSDGVVGGCGLKEELKGLTGLRGPGEANGELNEWSGIEDWWAQVICSKTIKT